MNNPAILLVEDNEDDVFLFRRALKAASIVNPVFVAEDGQMAIDYLAGVDRFADRNHYPDPAAVFLDLKLPIKNGFAVLSWVREQSDLLHVPVVILSSSSEPGDQQEAFKLGATAYQVKPPSPARLLGLAKELKWDWLCMNA
jgi:CheY-like chemotaxis protein